MKDLICLNENPLQVFNSALEVYYENTSSLKASEETQARAELLATMQQANAAGNLSLLREALQLLTTLMQP